MIKTIDTNMLTKEMIKAFYERVTVTTLGTLYNADDGIRALLEAAPAVEPVLNTCLSNAKQEPAQAVPQHVIEASNRIPQNIIETPQAVPVGRVLHWKGEPGLAPKTCIRGFDEYPKGYAQLGPWEEGENVYTVPPAIDYETKRMVMELCRNVMQNVASWSLADDAEAIFEKLGEGNGN